jgi:hypothetical protein
MLRFRILLIFAKTRKMTNEIKIQYLQRAGIGYMVAGLLMIPSVIPYWFLGKTVDDSPLLRTHHFYGIIKQVDDFKETVILSWNWEIATVLMLIAHYLLWKVGEPTGKKFRYFLLIPLIGSTCHIFCWMFPEPFAPLGTLLNALGMILVGIVSIRAKIWTGWKRFTPLFMGLFNFTIQFPLLFILGTPPYNVIPLWGIPIALLGFAAWQRSKEISSLTLQTIK